MADPLPIDPSPPNAVAAAARQCSPRLIRSRLRDADKRNRLFGVVGGLPARQGDPPRLDRLGVEEEALAEGISNGKASETRMRSCEAIGTGVGEETRVGVRA